MDLILSGLFYFPQIFPLRLCGDLAPEGARLACRSYGAGRGRKQFFTAKHTRNLKTFNHREHRVHTEKNPLLLQ
jgi:hypothetical protein